MKLTRLLLILPLFAGCASNAAAGYRGDRDRYYVDARVVHVEPMYRTVRVEQPRRECWDEDVYVERPGYRSHTGVILGGIVGGVLGHELGGRHHEGHSDRRRHGAGRLGRARPEQPAHAATMATTPRASAAKYATSTLPSSASTATG